MKHTFTVTLKDGAFEVPLDVKAIFGTARPPVKLTFLGETHATRIAVYGGKYIMGIWKKSLAQHGLKDGDKLEITIEPDEVPRVVEPPKELAAALKKSAQAKAGWTAMSFTHQREWATSITDAKAADTKARRVAKAIEAMVAKAKPKAKPKTNKKTAR